MLTHTLEENRKLKELSLRMERKVPDKKKGNQSPNSKDNQYALKIQAWEDALKPRAGVFNLRNFQVNL
jgi:hypothetical protein